MYRNSTRYFFCHITILIEDVSHFNGCVVNRVQVVVGHLKLFFIQFRFENKTKQTGKTKSRIRAQKYTINKIKLANQLEMKYSFWSETLLHGHWNKQNKNGKMVGFFGYVMRHTPRCSYRRASLEPTSFSSRPKWAS